jgi:hypothetical protein
MRRLITVATVHGLRENNLFPLLFPKILMDPPLFSVVFFPGQPQGLPLPFSVILSGTPVILNLFPPAPDEGGRAGQDLIPFLECIIFYGVQNRKILLVTTRTGQQKQSFCTP